MIKPYVWGIQNRITKRALKALEGDASDIGEESIYKLAEALDSYIPQPERAVDGAFLMPIEDVFSISGRGTVVTGRVDPSLLKTDGCSSSFVNFNFCSSSKSWFWNID